jgi:hypothetical protein
VPHELELAKAHNMRRTVIGSKQAKPLLITPACPRVLGVANQ